MRFAVIMFSALAVLTAQTALGQVDWLVFDDAASTSSCDIVNTADSELVVLDDTFELMIVTGPDTILLNTFVDVDNTVLINGEETGFIDFDTDGDGFRTLWWLTLNGRVVQLDAFSAEPFASDLFPSDIVEVPCDACEFIDDPPDFCFDTEPTGPILCGLGMGSNLMLTMAFCGFAGLRTMRR